MIKLIALAALTLFSAPMQDDITEFLPPDGTPPGWARDGGAMEYSTADLGDVVDNPSVFTGNNLQAAVVQWYRNGAKEVTLKIFDMGSNSSAEAAFSALTSNLEVGTDLGGGSIFEENRIIFFSRKYVVMVTSDGTGAEISQTIAALAMTVDAYLF